MENFNLQEYLSAGVERLVKEALRATLSNPRESAFLAKFALSAKNASAVRKEYKKNGTHIPPFLIASITSRCNLHCTGCYARSNHSCHDGSAQNQLATEDWERLFCEAGELGISFILLAGGEPLLRRDVLRQAADHPKIIFPVFTNGTLLDGEYLALFDKNRNLIPVLSLEGDESRTDSRRGEGVYEKLQNTMARLSEKKLLFGASITVTTENLDEVTSRAFIETLYQKGCRLVIFVEYVPVNQASKALAPTDADRERMNQRICGLRAEKDTMLFISFPGDEKSSGGCLAAGRGFFHINAQGSAEPCPFSPYSDTNIRNLPLLEALRSPLFSKLRESGCLTESHAGGCVLFEREDAVKRFLEEAI